MIVNPLETNIPFATVVLNNKLPKFFHDIWTSATIRICADGGANKVNDFYKANGIKNYLEPDCIVGNMTSIKKDVLNNSVKGGAQILKKRNILLTDTENCIKMLSDMKYKDPIVLLGAFDGLFECTATAIHAALKYPNLRIFLADDHNVSTWIFPKDKGIKTPMVNTTPVCGLLPLQKPTLLKTKGLKWDLDGSFKLTLGDFISTSNEVVSSEVLVKTQDPIFWTNEVKKVVKIIKDRKNPQ